MEYVVPFAGYKDEISGYPEDESAWARENPSMCIGWFRPALEVANGAGICERCEECVRVDANGEPVRHPKAPYLTHAQRGGARERVPL